MPKKLQFNGKIPTKLSDLENDLFCSGVKIPFLSVRKEDFKSIDGSSDVYFETQDRADWFTSIDKIWFQVSFGNSESDCTKITYDDLNADDMVYIPYPDTLESYVVGLMECQFFSFVSGIDVNNELGNTAIIAPVEDFLSSYEYVKFEIFKMSQAKKLSSEVIDYEGFPFIKKNGTTEITEDEKTALLKSFGVLSSENKRILYDATNNVQLGIPVITITSTDRFNVGELFVERVPNTFLLVLIPSLRIITDAPVMTIKWRVGSSITTRTYKLKRVTPDSTGQYAGVSNNTWCTATVPILVFITDSSNAVILNLLGGSAPT